MLHSTAMLKRELVDYGGDSLLPPAQEVIDLFNQYNIQRIRIYDRDPAPLQAGGGSSIELVLGVPDIDIPNLASSQYNGFKTM
ncbi:hypothetical protein POTOM_051390 [Populus tomentosa]|uniref:glucan endo-1,3-beta-D-glucosidase n=1 Tax=Populus tomentosa TaxID=118781 RepID=A0A8X7Y9J7_POPTO|nr:hypothetical protein POTOM_051390 [Populus tomentosa]